MTTSNFRIGAFFETLVTALLGAGCLSVMVSMVTTAAGLA